MAIRWLLAYFEVSYYMTRLPSTEPCDYHQRAGGEIPISGYQVLLGNLCAYLGWQVPPITPESLVGFERVWPTRDEPVVMRPWLVGGNN